MKRFQSGGEYRYDDSQDSSNLSLQVSRWDTYPSLDETPDDEALAFYLAGVINRLPDKQKDVVYLLMSGVIAVDGPVRSWRAAGRQLGVCHKTVKRRLTAALRSIESELLDSPPWVRELLLTRTPLEAPQVQAASGLPTFDQFMAQVRGTDER